MFANIGDRIVIEGTHLGQGRRIGEITGVGREGAPPYHVRWLDSGTTSLIYPGPEAHIEHPAPGGESTS